MEDSGKTLDSLPNQHSESTLDREQAWTRLTVEYLRELPQQLDAIRNGLDRKDYTTIKKQAHRIKGTSGTYRLESIAKSVAKLENLADNRNPDAISNGITRLMRLVELETKRLKSRLVPLNGRERNANGRPRPPRPDRR
jgi:HPt (histidine-containing phosphotransfer) domain-containing protein